MAASRRFGRFLVCSGVGGMVSVLHYGSGSTLQLELADATLVAECGRPACGPLPSPGFAATEALADPIAYPPLARCTTPGDRVCVVLDRGLPRAAEMAAGAVRALVSAGVGADGITVLRTGDDARADRGDPSRWLDRTVADRITLASHDPANRREMAYLATTRSGHPVLLNRAITDADLVVPVGCIRNAAGARDHGVHGAVFPTFSDARTLMRYRSPSAVNASGETKRAVVREVDEVGWLLGVNLTLQLVPGVGEEVLHVVAGEVTAVRERARELYRSAWAARVPRRASLVVATIAGGPGCQTWEALGEALATAARLVEDGGAIALCCELGGEPGPAIRRLSTARSRRCALEAIRRERPVDALAATQLARTLDRAHVYLLSRLDPDLLDELEIAPITDPDDVARLARRSASCILLANAPQALVAAEAEAGAGRGGPRRRPW